MIISGAKNSLKIAIVYRLSVASSTCLEVEIALKGLPKGNNKNPVISSVSLWRSKQST